MTWYRLYSFTWHDIVQLNLGDIVLGTDFSGYSMLNSGGSRGLMMGGSQQTELERKNTFCEEEKVEDRTTLIYQL